MSIQILDATPTDRTISAFKIIDAGSTDRTVSEMRLIDMSGVDRLVYSLSPPMSASATPSFVNGYTLGTGTASTSATTVTPTGGTGPYTYSWDLQTYTAGVAPTVDDDTVATTGFTQTGIGPGESYGATFVCTVTDSLGATAEAQCFAAWIDVS